MSDIQHKALQLLRSPSFFHELLSVKRKAGVVGEDRNALGLYVVGTSRLFLSPLCLFIKGPSSVGKNYLADAMLSLFSPSEVKTLSSSSPRAWNYLGDKMKHKILYIKERNKSSGPVHPTRLLISEKRLVHLVTVKKGNQFVQEERITEGPVAAISTTTQDRVEVDDETRHVSIWLDETPEQTQRIMEAAFTEKIGLPSPEAEVWHEVQRLIEARGKSPIEFLAQLKSLVHYVSNDNLWARRYFPAFLQACRVVTVIRSFLDEKKDVNISEPMVAGFDDLAVTSLIFNPIFAQSLDKADDQDLETRERLADMSKKNGGKPVRAADLARDCGISADRAYALLRKAAGAGTIVRANSPTQTNLKMYLPSTGQSFLPEPDELFQKMKLREHVKFVHPLTGEAVVLNGRASTNKK